LRIKEMDKMGVDIQVVSPTILQQCTYFAEPEQALKLERQSNDRLAELVAEHPGRLVGLGSVPLQDTGLAIQELERRRTSPATRSCRALATPGVSIFDADSSGSRAG
jgi:predicted TIM-barrel fold metal-dependent hydrolase